MESELSVLYRSEARDWRDVQRSGVAVVSCIRRLPCWQQARPAQWQLAVERNGGSVVHLVRTHTAHQEFAMASGLLLYFCLCERTLDRAAVDGETEAFLQ